MKTHRATTATIFKTVVFAGAMLGSPACSKKAPKTTPTQPDPQATTSPAGTTPAAAGTIPAANPCASGTTTNPCATADPCATDDPCTGRPRGTDEDGGGGMGRGFVLA